MRTFAVGFLAVALAGADRALDTHAQWLQRRIDRSPAQLARSLLRRLRRLATVG